MKAERTAYETVAEYGPEIMPGSGSRRRITSTPVPARVSDVFCMTEASIEDYLRWEAEQRVSASLLRKRRGFVTSLYSWLPEKKVVTGETLSSWRRDMEEKGYAQETVLNYIKGINRYLRFTGHSELCFSKGKPKDIAGRQFGYLTAIEPTGAKNRKDIVWKCQCRCGKTAELPATRLLTGNTLSCGCLKGEHLHAVNKYMDDTSIRQSLEDQVTSSSSVSGYTGVTPKRGKWKAYIKYKKKDYYLGCYSDLQDAVRARARAKQLVQEDARELLDSYEELHRNDPPRPNRDRFLERKKLENNDTLNKDEKQTIDDKSGLNFVRSNNTSGCTGVTKRRDRWTAKITYRKVTYQLGNFGEKKDAIQARKAAETLLKEDPAKFLARYS